GMCGDGCVVWVWVGRWGRWAGGGLPGGLGEGGDLGQAVARRTPRAVGPVALHAALPEQLAYGGVSRRCRCRRAGAFVWRRPGRLGGRTARGILGQVARLFLQRMHLVIKAVETLIETRRWGGFLRSRGRGEGADVRHQAARLLLADLPAPARHLILALEDSRQELRIAPAPLPGGLGEVGDLGQA